MTILRENLMAALNLAIITRRREEEAAVSNEIDRLALEKQDALADLDFEKSASIRDRIDGRRADDRPSALLVGWQDVFAAFQRQEHIDIE